MSLIFPASKALHEQIQRRLMYFAAAFMILYATILTLSPAVRYHSWHVEYKWMHWIGVVVWLAGFGFLHRWINRLLNEHDPYLLPLTAILSGWGLLTVWRLDTGFGLRQTIWLALGLAVMAVGLRLPRLLELLRRYKYIWLIGGLLLAGLTFLVGIYPGGNGPRLWLSLGSFFLQPSEFLKLILIIYLAAYMADQLPANFNLLQLLMPTFVLLGAALLILVAQRDLGTSSLFVALYALTIYLASGKKRVLILSLLVLVTAVLAGTLLFDVIRQRIEAWLNPWLDPSGRSYQVVQSLIAIASGGTFGRGVGLGSPGVVPVVHSDFIFAAITEETGMVGAFGILILLGILVLRGLRIALLAPSNYTRYLAAGITVYLVVQAILIMGGNLRLLPLTGVTLPFMSYGGSSLTTSFVAMLLLLIISSQSDHEPAFLRTSEPYLVTGGLLLLGLAAVGTLTAYWGYVRAGELVSRTDNPRWAVNDRYVMRGTLLDRNNTPLAITTGSPGSYTRQVQYPPLSNTLGYNNPTYGLAGLEAGLDPYLRGLEGNPASTLWIAHLLYGQPPAGLDVRLSLDLNLQRKADRLFSGKTGAAVLLNARTGEILAMSSQPYYDANLLDQRWADWKKQEGIFLNRAAQGLYPVGTAIGPFLLSTALELGRLPATSPRTEYLSMGCALPNPSADWGSAISNGCQLAMQQLVSALPESSVANIFTENGWLSAPDLPIPQAVEEPTSSKLSVEELLTKQDGTKVTPLQMALAAAAISNGGSRPSPRLALAVHSPIQGWTVLPAEPDTSEISAAASQQAAAMLNQPSDPFWQAVGIGKTDKETVTWFVAGTLPGWQGTPMIVVILLEEDNPTLASQIGRNLLQSTYAP